MVEAAWIFGLVFDDGNKQLPLLASVINLAQDEEAVNGLMNAADREGVYAVVKEYIS